MIGSQVGTDHISMANFDRSVVPH